MKKSVFFFTFLLLGQFSPFSLSPVSAMEPDEETLQDPAFVAKYGCTTEHFLVRKYYRDKEYTEAVKTIQDLEGKGYSDQSLTVAKEKNSLSSREL